jgi:hypothetical protein
MELEQIAGALIPKTWAENKTLGDDDAVDKIVVPSPSQEPPGLPSFQRVSEKTIIPQMSTASCTFATPWEKMLL